MDYKDFVSYKTAKKLKAAGFDEPCSVRWECEPDDVPSLCSSVFSYKNKELEGLDLTAPTLWQAQKWLREVKGIAINVICHEDDRRLGKYHWKDVILPNCNEKGHQWYEWMVYGKYPLFDSYEAALSAGIDKILDLIINKTER